MKILVPTDFSITSYNALHLAKKIAVKTNGEIILLHVIEPPSASFSSMGEFMGNTMDGVFVVKLIEKVQQRLYEIKENHKEVNMTVKKAMGNPYDKIKETATEENANLLIMGEKGVSSSGDSSFIGALTDKVVKSMKIPVITVNEDTENLTIENIVYATDLQKNHESMMKLLLKFQELFDAKLHIVKINTRYNFTNDKDNQLAFKRLVSDYKLKNTKTYIYNHEDEEEGIVYFSDLVHANLIALGIHQKSKISSLISGKNMAEDVASHTSRPVLTLSF